MQWYWGVVGFAIARRRGASNEDEPDRFDEPAEDVFSDVELKQQSISVEANEIKQEIEQEPPADSSRDNRGYGEHKHDEYASDVDASDALAEADIYIAYGRHPQAIDLLHNALDAEPSNPVYRLKLLEIYNELHDDAAASVQLDKIRANGDAGSITRAEANPSWRVRETRPSVRRRGVAGRAAGCRVCRPPPDSPGRPSTASFRELEAPPARRRESASGRRRCCTPS